MLYYIYLRLSSSLPRTGRVQTEVPPLLVQVRQLLPDLGLPPHLAAVQGGDEHGGDGPLRGPGHHNLHRPQHALHGHGALPNDHRVQQRVVCGEPGEWRADAKRQTIAELKRGSIMPPVD